MSLVEIVTIKEKVTLYKGGEPANAIELLRFEENGFEIVAQKNLYQVGDKGVYVLPDTCVPDNALFEGFVRPNGDESKSLLGKVNGKPCRVRAKEFKFSTSIGGVMSVYSNGILLPVEVVSDYISREVIHKTAWSHKKHIPLNDAEVLGVYKYEAPEDEVGGEIPLHIYKTDETNINLVWDKFAYPITLNVTKKFDGSSISIIVSDDYPEGVVMSRSRIIPTTLKRFSHKRQKTLLELLMFWKKVDTDVYKEIPNSNKFLQVGQPYIKILREYWEQNKQKYPNGLVLRGELIGQGMKGSGNKNNPDISLEPQIKFYNIDTFVNGRAKKVSVGEFYKMTTDMNLPICTVYDKKRLFKSKQSIINYCESLFANNMIEGVVLKTLDSVFSCKYMNNKYDSKK